MRTVRTAFAAILAVLAFAAFESSADAQARRGESGSSSGASRNTSVTKTRPSSSKPSGKVTRKSPERPAVTRPESGKPNLQSRPSGQVKPQSRPDQDVRKPSQTRPSVQTKPSAPVKTYGQPGSSVKRPSSQTRPSSQIPPSSQTRPSSGRPSVNARPQNGRPGNNASSRPSVRHDAGQRPDRPVPVRPDRRPEPQKIHPHHRDFITYDRPSHFGARSNHFYGHRVKMLPSFVRRHTYHGVTYYCHNDVWYRPLGGYYVVCRPPFGTVLAANLVADMVWTAVRLSYYNTVADTYSTISQNNAYIAQQNEVIARNNAEIAAQNQAIAMNQQLASQANALADRLGLIQSYASAGKSYFYQDGVFYTQNADGEYQVIVPPAGALVEMLPDDSETIVLDGNEYYKVDDTIYRVIVSEGRAYFEVLGQLCS